MVCRRTGYKRKIHSNTSRVHIHGYVQRCRLKRNNPVLEKFHKPKCNEYNAFPSNAISFISCLVVLLFCRRISQPAFPRPAHHRVSAEQKWNQIRISEMEHRADPERPSSDRSLRQGLPHSRYVYIPRHGHVPAKLTPSDRTHVSSSLYQKLKLT